MPGFAPKLMKAVTTMGMTTAMIMGTITITTGMTIAMIITTMTIQAMTIPRST